MKKIKHVIAILCSVMMLNAALPVRAEGGVPTTPEQLRQYVQQQTEAQQSTEAPQTAMAPVNPTPAATFQLYAVSDPAMYTYPMLEQDLAVLAAKYPGKFQIGSLGTSVQGRQLYQIIWGDPNAKYAVLVDASIHAREYINSQLVMAMLDWYANVDLGNVCFYIIPMANPDGVTLSQVGPCAIPEASLAWVTAAYQAEAGTYKTLDKYVCRWKANINGVDLNRNFPTGWEISKQKGYPGNALFKGNIPGSEPETQVLMAAPLQRHFELVINYHSMGNVIYYGAVQASQEIQAASKAWADFASGITGFRRVKHSSGQQGTYADYLTAVAGVPSITVESGARECPTSAAEFPIIYQHNIGLWGNVIRHFQEMP